MRNPSDLTVILAGIAGWWGFHWYAEASELGATRRDVEALAQPSISLHPPARSASGAPEPVLPYPRALRQARGIGRRRSLDLARYFWAHGPDAPADALPGIGPATAAAARLAVDRLTEAPAPSVPRHVNR